MSANLSETGLTSKNEVLNSLEVPYYYYDMLNVVAGASEVVLEFGNSLKSDESGAKMNLSHRAVLSVPAAFRLQQGLSRTLQMLQDKLRELQQEALKRQAAEKAGEK